jgi:WAS/WASL-interacting protein
MPAPPPPPPPIPTSCTVQKTKITENRATLLNEIHRGARLKKTVTNDRSAPLIGGKVEDNRPKAHVFPKAATINESLGALFSTGIPRKPSDVKSQKSSNSISTPALDEGMTMAKGKFVDEKVDLKSTIITPSLADLKTRNALQATSSTPSLPPPLPTKVLKQNSSIGQDFQNCKMPISQLTQFQTLRPAKAQPISERSNGLRRSESNEEIKCMTIKRPGAPPPPPPTTKPSNVPNPNIQKKQLQSNESDNKVTDTPRPPPRFSSYHESFEQRFHFVSISELPPPPRFVGFIKDYGIAGKKQLT